jgi:serine O-acetyltransferase
MLYIYRLAALLHLWHVPVAPRLLYIFNRIAFGVVLPPAVKVGPRTVFAYQGLAVVVHRRAVIGCDCYVGPQVIIGGRSGFEAVPVIGDRVMLGAGCRVMGPIRIGDGAKVGAGAVVVKDVEPGQTVLGNPARPIAKV